MEAKGSGLRNEKGRPHRATPITTNLCEECRISGLIKENS